MMRSRSLVFILSLVCFLSFCEPAHALDKRLKLLFKTAGYGALGGLVIGAGTTALGIGDGRNIFMGASSGMYAGILLAAYIVATPPEKDNSKSRNSYRARRPVGPDDWQDEDTNEEDLKEHLPPKSDDSSGPVRILPAPATKEVAIWAPLLSVRF